MAFTKFPRNLERKLLKKETGGIIYWGDYADIELFDDGDLAAHHELICCLKNYWHVQIRSGWNFTDTVPGCDGTSGVKCSEMISSAFCLGCDGGSAPCGPSGFRHYPTWYGTCTPFAQTNGAVTILFNDSINEPWPEFPFDVFLKFLDLSSLEGATDIMKVWEYAPGVKIGELLGPHCDEPTWTQSQAAAKGYTFAPAIDCDCRNASPAPRVDLW